MFDTLFNTFNFLNLLYLLGTSLVGYIIYLNPLLSFYTLIVVPLVIYPLIKIAKKLKKYSHRSQDKNADLVSRLTEVFNNSEILTVKN